MFVWLFAAFEEIDVGRLAHLRTIPGFKTGFVQSLIEFIVGLEGESDQEGWVSFYELVVAFRSFHGRVLCEFDDDTPINQWLPATFAAECRSFRKARRVATQFLGITRDLGWVDLTEVGFGGQAVRVGSCWLAS